MNAFRAQLTRCFAADGGEVTVDLYHLPLQAGDGPLLCTDGLTNMVNDSDLVSLVRQHTDVQCACQALVDAALENGGIDNVTVVMLCVDAPPHEALPAIPNGTR